MNKIYVVMSQDKEDAVKSIVAFGRKKDAALFHENEAKNKGYFVRTFVLDIQRNKHVKKEDLEDKSLS